MTTEDLMDGLITSDGKGIIKDLMEIIPSWKYVDLTKKGYNEQYVKTLIDVAIYVVEREKATLKEAK